MFLRLEVENMNERYTLQPLCEPVLASMTTKGYATAFLACADGCIANDVVQLDVRCLILCAGHFLRDPNPSRWSFFDFMSLS